MIFGVCEVPNAKIFLQTPQSHWRWMMTDGESFKKQLSCINTYITVHLLGVSRHPISEMSFVNSASVLQFKLEHAV